MPTLAEMLSAKELEKKGSELAGLLSMVRDSARNGMDRLDKSAPKEVHEAADFVASNLPGYYVMDSMRLGREAGGLWNQGNYGDALIKYSDALERPLNEAFFFIPWMKGMKVK